jgi:hypothetical protein
LEDFSMLKSWKFAVLILALVASSVGAQAQRSGGAHGLTAPIYCYPCLFYGGDFNGTSSNANGTANEDSGGAQAATFVPFIVPAGQTWTVTGLFTNDIADGFDGIDPAQAQWSISSGVGLAQAGTVVASGTNPASFNPTGRTYETFNEYTTLVKFEPTGYVTLASGQYWLTVVPVCSNTNRECDVAQYFISNTQELNKYGPTEPGSQSYVNSSTFNLDYTPACDVISFGCQAFSAGVLGTASE